MISDTKLDGSFPEGQILIPGCSTFYRIDQNCHGGGIMLFIREHISSKLLSIKNTPIEDFYIELYMQTEKWLLFCSYNPDRNTIDSHLDENLSRNLALYSLTYENYIVIDDFNVDDTAMSDFCNTFDRVELIKEPTCYKNLKKSFCIDLILTNKRHSFQNSFVIVEGLLE